MTLECEDTENTRVVTVRAERIDAASAIRFKDEMRALSDSGPDRVILDMSGVQFIDSSGLGAIVAAMKQLAPQRALHLAAPQPAVSKVFRLTRMDSIFPIHQSLDDALGTSQS